MKSTRKIFIIFGLLFSSPTFALSGPTDVEMIYLLNTTGLVYMKFSTPPSTTCTYNSTVVLLNTSSLFKEFYSALLSAQTAGKKIRYSTSGCYGGLYPQLQQLRIYKTDQ